MTRLRILIVAAAALPVLALFAAPSRAAEAPPPGLHHEIAVSIDPEARRLSATVVTKVPPGFSGALYLAGSYEVTEASATVGATTGGATTGAGPTPRPLGQSRDGAWRKFTLPAGATGLRLAYRGPLPPFDPQGTVGPAAGPEGAFLPAGGGWTPDDFGPTPPTWRLTVESVGPFTALATGKTESEEAGPKSWRGRFSEDRPVESPSLFVGPWTVTERMQGGVRYRTYLHPEQAALAGGLIDTAAQAIERYAAAIGPYPFAGFSIVSAPLPVGLGYPGMTYIGRQVLPLPFVRDRSLAHEALHNWWGNGVRIDPERGNWAEGLTTYMADHAVAEIERPATAAAIRLDWLRDFAALPAERETGLRACRNRRHDAQQVICYGKAAMLFHMLRQEIGDQAFADGAKEFWRRRQFRNADWDDLRGAFETVSKRDLAAFFSQWLDRPGAPSVRLTDAVADGRKVTLRLSLPGQPWRLRLPVRVETENGPETHVVETGQATETATLTVAARPLRVTVDPDHDVFRRLEPGETPLILRDFTLRRQMAAAVLGGGEDREAGLALVEALFPDGVSPVTAGGLTAGEAPLAVVGVVRDVADALNKLGIKSPLSVSARVTGKAWTARTRTGRPVLVIEANDAAALAAMARPLPHYRRESWITFNGRSALGHGTWSAGDGGLSRSFESTAK
jgi:aminopeptidase N